MTIIINQEASGSDYMLWRTFKELEAAWGAQEIAFKEDADKEALKSLQKQADVVRQKKVALSTKQHEKKREKRTKDIEANNKSLKRFFHPNGE